VEAGRPAEAEGHPFVHAIPKAVELFDRVATIFVEHASDDMLDLLPGHSYYLASDEAKLQKRMRYDLVPLLDEYLRQGLVGAMASELTSVRDEIDDYANGAWASVRQEPAAAAEPREPTYVDQPDQSVINSLCVARRTTAMECHCPRNCSAGLRWRDGAARSSRSIG
jgi:hypothetical protein